MPFFSLQCGTPSEVVKEGKQGSHFPQRPQNLTIVSAYIDLGTIPKGFITQGTANYLQWAAVFGRLDNALVFYTDSSEMKRLILNSRRLSSHPTIVMPVRDRNKLWAFGLRSRIESIFSNSPDYGKASESEKHADYTCSQHAKYEFMEDAMKRDLYRSDYYAWLDVGYFRDIVHLSHHFSLEIPCNFNSSRIAFNVVDPYISLSNKPAEIMVGQQLWIGGGFFFGRKSTMVAFAKQYRRAVEAFVAQGMINTDQQVIFSLFSDEGRRLLKPSVHIQLYIPEGNVNEWFYLGYLCMKVKQKVIHSVTRPLTR